MTNGIYLRAHTVAPEKPKRSPRATETVPRWPASVLVFDTETTTDTSQTLTFGAYRLCQLVDDAYRCVEEGMFYRDDASAAELRILEEYTRREYADLGVTSFPPRLRLVLRSRAQFVEKTFWPCVRNGGLIVGFNLPFDLSRLAVQWSTSRHRGWSFVLSLRRSRKTGELEPNPHRPRIRVTAKDSHSAFISSTKPCNPEEWPNPGRFLDVHTFARALYDTPFSLESLCQKLEIPGKVKHEPTGHVSDAEITYCRNDVRATVDALNSLKHEFDRHPLALRPDRTYSPASIAKAYLDAMGIRPPREKFDVTDHHLGIAMQAYYGGRAECRVRRLEAPATPTDLTSAYPTGNSLLDNWRVLTAASVSFEDATEDVRALLASVTLDDLFRPEFWTRLSFFALVRPDRDVLPVRTVYNGATQNIGVNYLTSAEPIWFAGPDVVASVLLAGRVPQVVRAIRLVAHGTQSGLQSTSLRGMVGVDPLQHDFFRHLVEQRQHYKRSDEPLAKFLKTVANAGSYGLFVEETPDAPPEPVRVKVFSGDTAFETPPLPLIERSGRWYFPPLAALITAATRLLLAMLERCVRDRGGTYLFCDTDSMCIVASSDGGSVDYQRDDGTTDTMTVLTRQDVDAIVARFASLNPYDPRFVSHSILRIDDARDEDGRPRQLLGFVVSAKRYVLYERHGDDIAIVDAKAHGLGYLYPPTITAEGDGPWFWDGWEWNLRDALGLPRVAPEWLQSPAFMRVVLSTPFVLARLNRDTRPYNFLFCPLVDPAVGFPRGVDPDRFTLIAPFTKDRAAWSHLSCINIHDGRTFSLALCQDVGGTKVIPQTFGHVLRHYAVHPEAKSLAPDGGPCRAHTRGMLQRAHITAGDRHYVGKETDRRWEQGEDLSLQQFKVLEYRPAGGVAVTDPTLRDQLAKVGMRALMRESGVSQHTLEAVREGRPVRRSTLRRVIAVLVRKK